VNENLEELKGWLSRRLGVGEQIEVLWHQLENDRTLSEYRDGYYDKNDILREARERIREAHELSQALGGASRPQRRENDGKESSRSPEEEYFEVDLGDYEEKRARAYEEVLAREAGLTREIADFRRALFGDRLLTPEQAHDLLDSPAARFLQPAFFERWHIPLIGHRAELLEYESSRDERKIDHRATLWVEPPGITKTVRYANDDAAEIDGKKIDWHWYLHWDAGGAREYPPSSVYSATGTETTSKKRCGCGPAPRWTPYAISAPGGPGSRVGKRKT
jgi:hypothetical protein